MKNALKIVFLFLALNLASHAHANQNDFNPADLDKPAKLTLLGSKFILKRDLIIETGTLMIKVGDYCSLVPLNDSDVDRKLSTGRELIISSVIIVDDSELIFKFESVPVSINCYLYDVNQLTFRDIIETLNEKGILDFKPLNLPEIAEL